MKRARLSPTVDRFLVMRFLEPAVFSLAGFAVVYLLADFFDRFDDLIHYHGLGWLALEYFTLKLPLIVSQLMPLACLAGVLLAFALLSRSGEVLAFQGLGISRLEIVTPVLAIALLISLLDFGLSETLVPIATRRARYLFTVELKGRKLNGVFADRRIWLRSANGFLSVESYNAKRKRLSGITFLRMGAHFELQDIEKADQGVWNGKQWQLDGVRVLRIADDGSVITGDNTPFHIGFKPDDFNLVRLDPEEFSLGELNRYIHSLRRKGLEPGGYVVDRDLKYAMPLACLVMVALGMALNLDPLPRHTGLGRSFALGIGISFCYWVILGFTSSFGRSELIPPWLAAWLPNAIFATIAAALFLLGEEH